MLQKPDDSTIEIFQVQGGRGFRRSPLISSPAPRQTLVGGRHGTQDTRRPDLTAQALPGWRAGLGLCDPILLDQGEDGGVKSEAVDNRGRSKDRPLRNACEREAHERSSPPRTIEVEQPDDSLAFDLRLMHMPAAATASGQVAIKGRQIHIDICCRGIQLNGLSCSPA